MKAAASSADSILLQCPMNLDCLISIWDLPSVPRVINSDKSGDLPVFLICHHEKGPVLTVSDLLKSILDSYKSSIFYALIFIAIKLVTDHSDGRVEDGGSHPTTFGQAVRTILVADFIMSIDNILSLAGVANTVPEGKWSLIICGLMISIPIVLFGAQIFLMIMLKVPALIYLGAGILGMTAAELMTEDKALGIYLAPYALELKVIFVIAVLLIGYAINRRREQQS